MTSAGLFDSELVYIRLLLLIQWHLPGLNQRRSQFQRGFILKWTLVGPITKISYYLPVLFESQIPYVLVAILLRRGQK